MIYQVPCIVSGTQYPSQQDTSLKLHKNANFIKSLTTVSKRSDGEKAYGIWKS
jgi:hypothetical protein